MNVHWVGFVLFGTLSCLLFQGCATTQTLYDFDEDGVQDADDCAPEDRTIYPGADDPFGDGVDQDCDGGDGIDLDGDGYPQPGEGVSDEDIDCDDSDPDVHPGADDPDDSIDQDCDGFARSLTVQIFPAAPTTLDTLVVQINTDAAVYAVEWSLDGEAQTGLTGFESIDSSQTAKNQVWTVRVTPYASQTAGGAGEAAEASVTILNTPPTATLVVGLEPGPREADTLTASVSTLDADGDPVTVSFDWFVSGVLVNNSGAEVLDGSSFDKGDEIYATLTPNDGEADGESAVTNTVTAVNTLPVALSLTISPTTGNVATVFVCTPSGWTDPDPDDSEAYSFQWTVAPEGGAAALSVQTAPITGTDFERGSVLQCSATPYDTDESGVPLVSAQVTVSNAIPSIASLLVTPAAVVEGNTIIAATVGWNDADGDVESVDCFWTVQPADTALSPLVHEDIGCTLGSNYWDKGDTVSVVGTPTDAFAEGTPVAGDSAVVVLNTAPSLASVTVTSNDPKTDEDLFVVATSGYEDPDPADQSTQDISYDWTVTPYSGDDDDSAGGDDDDSASPFAPVTYADHGESLSSSTFQKGDTIQLVATPWDDEASGTSVSPADPIVVANSEPSAPVIAITPPLPQPEDDLVCAVTVVSSDPDADEGVDTLTTSYAWYRDDETTPSGTEATLPASNTADGETWTCEVTVTDGEASVYAEVEVGVSELVVNCTALELDGEAGYLDLGEPASLDYVLIDAFSIELWLKPRSEQGPILVRGDSWGDAVDQFVQIILESGGAIGAGIRGAGGSSTQTWASTETGVVSNDQWSHIVVSVDRSNQLEIYVNGELEADAAETAGAVTLNLPRSWMVGKDGNGQYGSAFDSAAVDGYLEGSVAGLRFWNIALTPSQVSNAIVNSLSSTLSESVVAYFPLTDPQEEDPPGGDGLTAGTPGQSCLSILSGNEEAENDTYWLDPDGDGAGAFQASCDMDDGGWTVVARGIGASHTGWLTTEGLNTANVGSSSATFKFDDATINSFGAEVYRFAGTGNVEANWYWSGVCAYAHTSVATEACLCSYAEPDLTGTTVCGVPDPNSHHWGMTDWTGTTIDVDENGVYSDHGWLHTAYGGTSGHYWNIRDHWDSAEGETCGSADSGCDVELAVRGGCDGLCSAEDTIGGLIGIRRGGATWENDSCPNQDSDQDGAAVWQDCNDWDPDVHPDATDISYDGIDQDCDGYDADCTSLDFDGADDWADVEDISSSVAFPGGNLDWTFEAWMDYDWADSGGYLFHSNCHAVHHNPEGSFGVYMYPDCSGTGQRYRFEVSGLDFSTLPSGWQHFAMTSDGTGYARFWVNGVLIGESTSVLDESTSGIYNGGLVAKADASGNTESTSHLPVALQTVRLSSVDRYGTGGFSPPVDLLGSGVDSDTVLFYDFTDTGADELDDLTSNGYNAVIHGAAWQSGCALMDVDQDDEPSWTDCDDADGDQQTGCVTCSGGTLHSFDGTDYAFCPTAVDWNSASTACLGMGGHLVQAAEEVENEWLWTVAGYQSTDPRWIGLNRQTTAGWAWQDTSPVGEYFPMGDPSSPDWEDTSRECIYTGHDDAAEWYPDACTVTRPYICELFPVGECVPASQTYSTAGTFSFEVPEGCEGLTVSVWGSGGGGGSGCGGCGYGGSGGGGGYATGSYEVESGAVYSVAVGAGGAGADVGGNDGGSGATSSFEDFLGVSGAGGGEGAASSIPGAAGAAGSGWGGQTNLDGEPGGAGQMGSWSPGGDSTGPDGGTGGGNPSEGGLAATAPGGGGGPSGGAGQVPGAGMPGRVEVFWSASVELDEDGDGYLAPEDCNDEDEDIHPYAGDTWGDGEDPDCDGVDCEAGLWGSTYFVICEPETYSEGATTCGELGYTMASVRSLAENAFVQNLHVNSGLSSETNCTDDCQRLWIGLSDEATEGTYVWEDGYTGTFSNWHPGEPSNSGGIEDCTLLDAHEAGRDGNWNDGYCPDEFPVLCQERGGMPATLSDIDGDGISATLDCDDTDELVGDGASFFEVADGNYAYGPISVAPTSVTVEWWINYQAPATSTHPNNMAFSNAISDSTSGGWYCLSSPEVHRFVGEYADSGSQFDVAVTSTLNTWYHVACEYDGTTARLYRDGELLGDLGWPGGLEANSEDFLIFHRNQWISASDEKDYWVRSLHISDAARYNGNAFTPEWTPVPDGDTLAYYPFDEGAASDIADSTTTLTSFTVSGPEDEWGSCP